MTHPLVGVWIVEVEDATRSRVTHSFRDDGTVLVTSAFHGAQGVWRATGERSAELVVMRPIEAADRAFVGWQSARGSVEVSEDGEKWLSAMEKVEYWFFSNWGPQRFHYQLRCRLSGDARLKRLAMINDLQMALLALPEMIVGKNTFTYWHVRAKNEEGVWGPWSKTWSFTPRGPAYPLDVTLDFDRDKGVGTLKWKANLVGRRPVK